MNIRSLYGPWFSLGIHIDIKHYKIELHFAWWIITLGNTRSSVHCGHCDYDMGYEVLSDCPNCGAVFATDDDYLEE